MTITINSVESLVIGILIGFCFTSAAFVLVLGWRKQESDKSERDAIKKGQDPV